MGTRETGVLFTDFNQIKPELVGVITENKDKRYVVYNYDKRIHFKSEQTIGKVQLYPSKFKNGNPNILVKKGKDGLIDKFAQMVSEKLKIPIKFYSKDGSEFITPFLETVYNDKNQKCMNVVENDKEMLMPMEELDKKLCSFTAVLKAGLIKPSTKSNELVWGFTVVELNISEIPSDYEGYFTVLSAPKVSFAKKC